MHVPDDRLDIERSLAIDPGYKSQDPMCRWVLGTDVQSHVLGLELHRNRRLGKMPNQILV
jgi:hypothetical protein